MLCTYALRKHLLATRSNSPPPPAHRRSRGDVQPVGVVPQRPGHVGRDASVQQPSLVPCYGRRPALAHRTQRLRPEPEYRARSSIRAHLRAAGRGRFFVGNVRAGLPRQAKTLCCCRKSLLAGASNSYDHSWLLQLRCWPLTAHHCSSLLSALVATAGHIWPR